MEKTYAVWTETGEIAGGKSLSAEKWSEAAIDACWINSNFKNAQYFDTLEAAVRYYAELEVSKAHEGKGRWTVETKFLEEIGAEGEPISIVKAESSTFPPREKAEEALRDLSAFARAAVLFDGLEAKDADVLLDEYAFTPKELEDVKKALEKFEKTLTYRYR